MEVLKFIYNEKEVSFETGKNLMINATEMAKIHKKRIDRFLRSDHAKAFIKELELTPFGGRSTPLKREEIIKTVNGVNTWMHKVLALKFAAWLDTKFELWVFTTIDRIVLGHFAEVKEATIEKLKIEKELKQKKEKLITENPELAEFFELELKLTKSDKQRVKIMKEAVGQLKLNLFA